MISLVVKDHLRRRRCRGPAWWTVCRCGCSVNPQRCPGRFPDADGTTGSRAPGGSCCRPHRPSSPSSPPAPPAACTLPVCPGYRWFPDPASVHHPHHQSLSGGQEKESWTQLFTAVTGCCYHYHCIFQYFEILEIQSNLRLLWTTGLWADEGC